jgi:hypothetical protein
MSYYPSRLINTYISLPAARIFFVYSSLKNVFELCVYQKKNFLLLFRLNFARFGRQMTSNSDIDDEDEFYDADGIETRFISKFNIG